MSTATEATAPPEASTITYRVFLFNEERTDKTWNEMPPLVRENVQYFYPSADDLGTKYGAGTFMFFEDAQYKAVRFMEEA